MDELLLKQNKIYVTGIAGMLGYNIYKTLKDRAIITGLDVTDTVIPGLSYQNLSLYDREGVEKSIAEAAPDVLVHTAAMVHVDGCEERPEEAKRLNTIVTEQIAEICHKYRIKMVYISTDAVFDGENLELYKEEDPVNPMNVYGQSKLDGEKCVLKYSENLVLRTNIYGINIQKKQSFGEWIYHSLKEGKTLNMFADIDFSPILVNELAELIYLSCQKNLCGLYHACGTGCITKYEFGMELKRIFQIDTGCIVRTTSDNAHFKARRSKHMGMSNSKLCDALQIQISTPLESIEKFYNLMKEDMKNEN